MIVDDSWSARFRLTTSYHAISSTIISYHSFWVCSNSSWDSFSRLTTRMIVHDSFSVSFFGNHRPDSGYYFLKCFTVHGEHFVLSGSILHSQFFHQFLHSAFVSPFDPLPCPSSLPPTLSRFIFRTFLQQNNYKKTSCRPLSSRKIFCLQVCLKERH